MRGSRKTEQKRWQHLAGGTKRSNKPGAGGSVEYTPKLMVLRFSPPVPETQPLKSHPCNSIRLSQTWQCVWGVHGLSLTTVPRSDRIFMLIAATWVAERPVNLNDR